MTDIADKAWKEDGTALWKAVEKYAPAPYWNRYVELGGQDRAALADRSTVTPPLTMETVSDVDFALARDEADSPLNVDAKLIILEGEMKSFITAELRTGKLLAVGFLAPKTRGVKPIWIVAEHWTGAYIDFSGSKMWSGDYAFEDIRVLPARNRSNKHAAGKEKEHAEDRISIGRPSAKNEILEAWNALMAEKKIPVDTTKKAIAALVREKVYKLHPDFPRDDSRLHDKTLYKYVSPLYDEYRSSPEN